MNQKFSSLTYLTDGRFLGEQLNKLPEILCTPSSNETRLTESYLAVYEPLTTQAALSGWLKASSNHVHHFLLENSQSGWSSTACITNA